MFHLRLRKVPSKALCLALVMSGLSIVAFSSAFGQSGFFPGSEAVDWAFPPAGREPTSIHGTQSPPVITLSPAELDVTLEFGQATVESLTIGNEGDIELSWMVAGAAVNGEVLTGGVVDCERQPGIIIHDDDTAENKYSGTPGQVTEIIFADRFTPAAYPASFDAVCVGLVSDGTTSLEFEVVIFAADGDNGIPGTELGAMPVSASDIPVDTLEPAWYSYDISPLNIHVGAGSVYIGIRFTLPDPNVYIAADESTSTPPTGGYWWFDALDLWFPITLGVPAYRALFVRAVVQDMDCDDPASLAWLSIDPDAGAVSGGDSATLDIHVDTAGAGVGQHLAQVCILSNDPVRSAVPVPILLTVSGADLAFEPSLLDFDEVPIGTSSPPQTVMLHNAGDVDATGLNFTSPNPVFEIDAEACGEVLVAGTECEITVVFWPVEFGPAGAKLMVETDQGAPANLTLTGTGGEPLPDPILHDRFEGDAP